MIPERIIFVSRDITVQRMHIAGWIPNATNTHSEYVIRIAFPLQQRLRELGSMLRHTYIACLVTLYSEAL